jgi:hypothetical protein
MKRTTARRAAVGLAAGTVAALAASAPWIRKRHMRWGATDEEIGRALPLDDRIPDPTYVTNRAIAIHAPVEAVWPWIAQMGEVPRGGFYSYVAVERLLGLRVENADRILPEFQEPAVGDALDRAGTLRVQAIEPNRCLVLGPPEGLDFQVTWALAIFPAANGTTRLLSRCRAKLPPGPKGAAWRLLLDPGQLIMERRMLGQIKRRAERHARPKAADMVRPPFTARERVPPRPSSGP